MIASVTNCYVQCKLLIDSKLIPSVLFILVLRVVQHHHLICLPGACHNRLLSQRASLSGKRETTILIGCGRCVVWRDGYHLISWLAMARRWITWHNVTPNECYLIFCKRFQVKKENRKSGLISLDLQFIKKHG